MTPQVAKVPMTPQAGLRAKMTKGSSPSHHRFNKKAI